MVSLVKLQPITMQEPTAEGIYSPSRLLPIKSVTGQEFLELADRAQAVLVSLEPDGTSRARRTTAYFKWPHWYILSGPDECDEHRPGPDNHSRR